MSGRMLLLHRYINSFEIHPKSRPPPLSSTVSSLILIQIFPQTVSYFQNPINLSLSTSKYSYPNIFLPSSPRSYPQTLRQRTHLPYQRKPRLHKPILPSKTHPTQTSPIRRRRPTSIQRHIHSTYQTNSPKSFQTRPRNICLRLRFRSRMGIRT